VRILLAALVVLGFHSPAEAHALGVECRVRAGRVEVKAFFSDGSRAANARVVVQDAEQQRMADGRTDERGLWSFRPVRAGRYRVIIDAGAGHQTEETIEIKVEHLTEDAPEARVSQGPTEEEFTGFPVSRVIVGLAALIGFSALLWVVVRQGRRQSMKETT
jgi:nickel transport protein